MCKNINETNTCILRVGVYDTANFGIDPIPSKYRASIADTDTDSDTCHLKIKEKYI